MYVLVPNPSVLNLGNKFMFTTPVPWVSSKIITKFP